MGVVGSNRYRWGFGSGKGLWGLVGVDVASITRARLDNWIVGSGGGWLGWLN